MSFECLSCTTVAAPFETFFCRKKTSSRLFSSLFLLYTTFVLSQYTFLTILQTPSHSHSPPLYSFDIDGSFLCACSNWKNSNEWKI
jgi:hypothetical protein